MASSVEHTASQSTQPRRSRDPGLCGMYVSLTRWYDFYSLYWSEVRLSHWILGSAPVITNTCCDFFHLAHFAFPFPQFKAVCPLLTHRKHWFALFSLYQFGDVRDRFTVLSQMAARIAKYTKGFRSFRGVPSWSYRLGVYVKSRRCAIVSGWDGGLTTDILCGQGTVHFAYKCD